VKTPQRGEVWLVDLGLAAKIRPCVVFSVPIQGEERSLITLIPHTTAVRDSRFEAAVNVRALRPGAFDAQGIVTVPTVRLVRPITTLTTDQMQTVETHVCAWLGIDRKD